MFYPVSVIGLLDQKTCGKFSKQSLLLMKNSSRDVCEGAETLVKDCSDINELLRLYKEVHNRSK